MGFCYLIKDFAHNLEKQYRYLLLDQILIE